MNDNKINEGIRNLFDGPSLKFDNSHISKHHRLGTYDHAITQKGYYGNNTFQSYTNVDRNGNVLDSGIKIKK